MDLKETECDNVDWIQQAKDIFKQWAFVNHDNESSEFIFAR